MFSSLPTLVGAPDLDSSLICSLPSENLLNHEQNHALHVCSSPKVSLNISNASCLVFLKLRQNLMAQLCSLFSCIWLRFHKLTDLVRLVITLSILH